MYKREVDGPDVDFHDVQKGTQIRCTDTENTNMNNKDIYTIHRLWGEVSKKTQAFVEVLDPNGKSIGEFGLWRFIPINVALESAAEEYEEILGDSHAYESIVLDGKPEE